MRFTALRLLILAVIVAAGVDAFAQTATIQGRRLFLYDGGTTSTLHRMGLSAPSEDSLTTNYSLILPKTLGTEGDILFLNYNDADSGALEFTSGDGLFWKVEGNSHTVADGTNNLIGMTSADPIHLITNGDYAMTVDGTNQTIGVGALPGGVYQLEVTNNLASNGMSSTVNGGGVGLAAFSTDPGGIGLSSDAADIGLVVGVNTSPLNGIEVNAQAVGIMMPNGGSAPVVGISIDNSANGVQISNSTTAILAEGDSRLLGDVLVYDNGSGGASDDATNLRIRAGSSQGTVNHFVVVQNDNDNLFVIDEQNPNEVRVQLGLAGSNDSRLVLHNGANGGSARIFVQNNLNTGFNYVIPTIEAAGRFVVADGSGTVGQVLLSNGNNNRSVWTDLGSVAWILTGNGHTVTDNVNNLLGTTTNAPLRLITNGNTAVTINTSQDVGIGAAPIANTKLNVDNVVNVTGTTYNGGRPAYRVNGTNFLWGGAGGNDNTFVGPTGNSTVSGNENVAVGRAALPSLTTGSNNVAIGNQANFSLQGGSANISIGLSAMYQNVSGTDNIALGNEAGGNNTGSDNVFIGRLAGRDQTGSGNIIIGNGQIGGAPFGANNILAIDNNSPTTPLIFGDMAADRLVFNVATAANSLNVPGTAQTAGSSAPNVRVGHLAGPSLTTAYPIAATNGFLIGDNNGDIRKWDPQTVISAFISAGQGITYNEAASTEIRLGSATPGTNPINTGRNIRLSNGTGSLTFDDNGGTNVLLEMAGGAGVNINNTGTLPTTIGNSTNTGGVTIEANANIAINPGTANIITTNGGITVGNGTASDVVIINNGGAADLNVSETTISRANANIAINPGSANLVTTDGGLTVNQSTILGDGTGVDATTFNTGGGNVTINSAGGPDLVMNETTISRANANININPGSTFNIVTNGGLDVAEGATIDGNTTLGDAAGDVVAFNAGVINVPNIGAYTPAATNTFLMRSPGNQVQHYAVTGTLVTGTPTNNRVARFDGSGSLVQGQIGDDGTNPLTVDNIINMQNNRIENIGAAGTDFSVTGGLTLADELVVTAGGADLTGQVDVVGETNINLSGTNRTYIGHAGGGDVLVRAGDAGSRIRLVTSAPLAGTDGDITLNSSNTVRLIGAVDVIANATTDVRLSADADVVLRGGTSIRLVPDAGDNDVNIFMNNGATHIGDVTIGNTTVGGIVRVNSSVETEINGAVDINGNVVSDGRNVFEPTAAGAVNAGGALAAFTSTYEQAQVDKTAAGAENIDLPAGTTVGEMVMLEMSVVDPGGFAGNVTVRQPTLANTAVVVADGETVGVHMIWNGTTWTILSATIQ